MMIHKKKTHATRGMRFYYVFVALVSLYLGLYAVSVVNDVFAFVKEDVTATVTVEIPDTPESISNRLWEAGVISHPEIFACYAKELTPMPGDYTVSALLDYADILAVLTREAAPQEP